ncbi:TolC family protein [Hydromonas duriensis]|nr:TolC family protein [Hydromonas duriensis]
MNLAYQMGQSTDIVINLPDIAAPSSVKTEGLEELNTWLGQVKQHPAIAAAKAKLASAKADVRSAQSTLLPTVDFNASYYQNGYPGQGLASTRTNVATYGLALNVPLFDGFAEYYKVKAAQEQVEKNEIAVQDTEQQITAQVSVAYANAMSSWKSLQASESMLVSASELLKSTERSYAHGYADVIDMINAQNTYAQVMQERVQS